MLSPPRPASAPEPKPSPTPTSTGSPEPWPQPPGTVLQGASGWQEHRATPSAWSRQQSGSRRRSLYVDQLAISAAAKPPNRLICARHSAPAPTMTMKNAPDRRSDRPYSEVADTLRYDPL